LISSLQHIDLLRGGGGVTEQHAENANIFNNNIFYVCSHVNAGVSGLELSPSLAFALALWYFQLLL
jgi:hypothetical protein